MQVQTEKKLLELYTQFLMVSTSQVSATMLSSVLDKEISHDSFTRLLSHKTYVSDDLWKLGKKAVRRIESADGVLIIDDHVEEKPYMDENDLIAWHYDHSVGRSVKGINQLSMLYHANEFSMPVGFRFVHKTEIEIDKKTLKERRVSPISKNEHYRSLLKEAVLHQILFRYVLNDIWFSSAENMVFVHKELKKNFVMPIKENRKVALSKTDKLNGKYQNVSQLDLASNSILEVWLEGVDFPLHLNKQVFTNKDDSQGSIYLVTDDLTIDAAAIQAIYHKRWKVEEHHKSIKSNLNYSKSPAHTAKTQANHCFAVLYAAIQWESLTKKLNTNHFALKAKMYLHAIKAAWKEISELKVKVNTILPA